VFISYWVFYTCGKRQTLCLNRQISERRHKADFPQHDKIFEAKGSRGASEQIHTTIT